MNLRDSRTSVKGIQGGGQELVDSKETHIERESQTQIGKIKEADRQVRMIYRLKMQSLSTTRNSHTSDSLQENFRQFPTTASQRPNRRKLPSVTKAQKNLAQIQSFLFFFQSTHSGAEKLVGDPILMITSGDVNMRHLRLLTRRHRQRADQLKRPKVALQAQSEGQHQNIDLFTTHGNKRIASIDPTRHHLSTVSSRRQKPHQLNSLAENSTEIRKRLSRQRANVASADYNMGSRLSHMIVDDFNDYAALLGINTSFTDAVPYKTGLTQETSRNAYEDSVISTTTPKGLI